MDRRQSFQDFRAFRDKFVGRVEFKDTLRRTNEDSAKKPTTTVADRSPLRDLRYAGSQSRGRPFSGGDVRDFVGGERSGGYLIETDFDFRSPPSTRDSSRDRVRTFDGRDGGSVTPRRGQEQIYATPVRRTREAVGEPIYAPSSVAALRRSREQLEDVGGPIGMSSSSRRLEAMNDYSGATYTPSNTSSAAGPSAAGAPLRRKELKVVISEPLSPGVAGQRHHSSGGTGAEYADPLSPTTPKDPLRLDQEPYTQ